MTYDKSELAGWYTAKNAFFLHDITRNDHSELQKIEILSQAMTQ